ncbi:hypothetical protein J2S09_004401 [Bacillus fengqiuensis]|nr:hypothetical protein [Bacillus fengqiuensis]
MLKVNAQDAAEYHLGDAKLNMPVSFCRVVRR